MIYPMVRVRLMGPRARLGEVLAVVQDVGLLHLAAAPEGGPLRPSPLTPVESRRRRQLMRILEDADAVLEGSSPSAAPAGAAGTSDLARWARLARRVRRSLGRLGDRAAALEEEQALLQ